MKELRDALQVEATHLPTQQRDDLVRTRAALLHVLEQIKTDIATLQIHIGTLRGELTAMAAEELTERLAPVERRITQLEAAMRAIAVDARELGGPDGSQ